MRIPKNIRDNLRFLIAEVESQVSTLQTFFMMPSVSLAQRIKDRGGYAYNLKMRIHDSCLNRSAKFDGAGKQGLSLRAMESIATDLERIAELCRDCIHQMERLQCKHCLQHTAYEPILEHIVQGIGLVERALQESDTRLALKIGRFEQKVGQAHKKLHKNYTAALKGKKHTEDLISALFAAHSVEQMGNALLNVSEAIISINLGQPVNIDRYHSMKASVEVFSLPMHPFLTNEEIDLISETIKETV